MRIIRFFVFELVLVISVTIIENTTARAVSSSIRFAVVGDYGSAGKAEADVASLIKGWSPDFIITLGDNNYPLGSASTIDANIGQYYHDYIYPYSGAFGTGATFSRFFPILGNHDWYSDNAQPYLDYFNLPGNERYYDFINGPVHFFALDSDPSEPDGVTQSSIQGMWLQQALSSSTSRWQIVLMHHPPYSSSSVHGSTTYMQWDFQSWGADAIMAGHDHTYERIYFNGLPYFVNGTGGASLYPLGAPVFGSQFRFNQNYGAMLVTASDTQLNFQYRDIKDNLLDEYTLGTIFTDVSEGYWAWSWINRLYNAHLTGGCNSSPAMYCPGDIVTRAQMAIFLLRGIHGSSYLPPTVDSTTGFSDVPADYWAAAWIKELAIESITSGCGNGRFCPDTPVTRDQMAVFLLRARYGGLYQPPIGEGNIFDDIPLSYWAVDWIEQLAKDSITSGCNINLYCPTDPVTRAQMAVFLVKSFNLQ